MSHYRPKLKFNISYDLYVYSTDVYFNSYPQYNVQLKTFSTSFYILDKRIANLLRSYIVRNMGLRTTQLNGAEQHILTDVENYQRHCIFWGNRNHYPFGFRYTSDRNVVITSYDDNAWWNLISYAMELNIHGLRFTMFGMNKIRIHTYPHLEIVFHQ